MSPQHQPNGGKPEESVDPDEARREKRRQERSRRKQRSQNNRESRRTTKGKPARRRDWEDPENDEDSVDWEDDSYTRHEREKSRQKPKRGSPDEWDDI